MVVGLIAAAVIAATYILRHAIVTDMTAKRIAKQAAQEAFDTLQLPDPRDPQWENFQGAFVIGPVSLSCIDSRYSVWIANVKIYPYDNLQFGYDRLVNLLRK